MKTQVATVLALVGVLGAGSAAALVNTSILDSPTESGASAAVVPPASSVDVPVPPATVATPTTTAPKPSPSTSTSTTSTTSPPTTVAAAPSTLTAFNVGDAGVVTADIVDGRLILLGAEPAQGWAVTDSEQDDDGIEVDFESGTVRVRFEATIEDGRIVPHVESESIGSASRAAPVPAGSGSSSRAGSGSPAPVTAPPAQASTWDDDDHDDDHDDEYEYEEHDEREDHDDDHDEVERDDD